MERSVGGSADNRFARGRRGLQTGRAIRAGHPKRHIQLWNYASFVQGNYRGTGLWGRTELAFLCSALERFK